MTVSRSYFHDVRPFVWGNPITANSQTALEDIPHWRRGQRRQSGQVYYRHLPPQLFRPHQLSYSIHPLRNWPVSYLLHNHPSFTDSRIIPAFTTTTSAMSTLELTPATALSFWSRTTFLSTQRILCTLRTTATRSPTATISVVPRTRLPLALSPPSPTTTRYLRPAPSSPTSPPAPAQSSPSDHQYICKPNLVDPMYVGPGIWIKRG